MRRLIVAYVTADPEWNGGESEQTAGHGTTGSAEWYQRQLAELLQAAPRAR